MTSMIDDKTVEVTQADRELRAMMDDEGREAWLSGKRDHYPTMQAIARHRLASTPSVLQDGLVTQALVSALEQTGDDEADERAWRLLNFLAERSFAIAALSTRARPNGEVTAPEGIFVPYARGSCGWPPEHNWQEIGAGISKSGWAEGEPMHISRCRCCGEIRGPFINNSSDAGF